MGTSDYRPSSSDDAWDAPKDSWGSPELSSMESDDPLVWTQYPTYDDD